MRRVSVEELLPGVYRVTARFGFMETPDVGEALRVRAPRGLRVFAEDCSFFLGRHVVRARPLPGLRGLQRRLFALHAAAQRAGRGVLPHAGPRRGRADDGGGDVAHVAPLERGALRLPLISLVVAARRTT